MQSLTAAAGETIFAPGDSSQAVYIIEDGEVVIQVGEGGAETEVARLFAGDLFGESGVLEARPRSARAIATRQTALLVTPGDDFLHAFGLDNDRALVILKLLCRRLRGSNLRIAQPETAHPEKTHLETTHLETTRDDAEAAGGSRRTLCLVPADDRIAAAMPAAVDVRYLPFQVGNRFGGETLPITSNRSLCIPVRGDPELSAPHFEIFRRDGQIHVRDLASRHGTIVNGMPIDRSSREPFAPLRTGDNLIIAGRSTSPFKFRLRLEQAA